MKIIKAASLAATLCVVAFSSTALAQQQVVSVTQDKSFQPVKLTMRSPMTGGYEGRAALKNIGGKLAMCGVGTVTNAQVASTVNQALRGATVKVNGKTVLKNFRFFAKAKRRSELNTAKANCKVIGPLPKRSDKVSVKFGSATFRN